jgi:hypothetical protein
MVKAAAGVGDQLDDLRQYWNVLYAYGAPKKSKLMKHSTLQGAADCRCDTAILVLRHNDCGSYSLSQAVALAATCDASAEPRRLT